MSAFGSAFYLLLEVNTLRALVGNLPIFVRIWIRILPVVQSADPHVRRSAFYTNLTDRSLFSRLGTCLELCWIAFTFRPMHQFFLRCMECQRGLATKKVSVHPFVCLSNAWIVIKRKKDLSRFLYHTKDHLV